MDIKNQQIKEKSKMKISKTKILLAALTATTLTLAINQKTEHSLEDLITILNPQEELGTGEIKSVQINKNEDGILYANIQYKYQGSNVPPPEIRVTPKSQKTSNDQFYTEGRVAWAKQGEHNVKIEISRPSSPQDEFTTQELEISIQSAPSAADGNIKKIATSIIPYIIEWPNYFAYEKNYRFSKKSLESLYKEAVAFIDSGRPDNLEQARKNLERILLKDHKYISAYPELARYSMKTNWSNDGLKQAEAYLKTGISLQDGHADSHVLLGYVYTHQNRLNEAETEFKKAEQLKTENLWLWSNWGDLYAYQDQKEAAINSYFKAIAAPRPYNTYDRARLDAYLKLFDQLDPKTQSSQINELFEKRTAEYPNLPCLQAEHAAFKISALGDYSGAITSSRRAIDNGCDSQESRQTLGIANYMAWATLKDESREKHLQQAKIFFPESPWLFYQLSKAHNTQKALHKLIDNNKSIDIKDNNNYSALAYALTDNDTTSARHLLELGASATELVSKQNYPAALIPILYQYKEGVTLLLDKNVNLSKIEFQGKSARQYADQLKNKEILSLIDNSTQI